MKKTRRSEIPTSVRSQIAQFYEGSAVARLKCVVTNEYAERQLHHLDENPNNSKIQYNLLPLRADLNINIENRKSHALNELITSEGLKNRSAQYYSEGRFAYGYACSILGASLAANTPWNSDHPETYFIDAETAIFLLQMRC